MRRTAFLLACAALLFCAQPGHTGGVLAVAGPTGFNPDVVGKPITWANATLSYYTDLGELSPVLTQESANTFVADAFSRWTSVTTASLSATRGGALAQDINGSNVTLNGGAIAMPADIQATATNRPVGVVYDQDGSVTDALLGAGAGGSSFCASNAVYGGVDAYTLDAHFAHALLVLNGNCAQTSADLPTFRYRLLRAVGRVLGVGWSQLNDNVRTGTPAPTGSEVLGFPLMHPRGPTCGVVPDCLTNSDQLRMDDRAALAALYPANPATGIRIRGRVFFTNERGQPGQPMQGVNVVARWIDPANNQPSAVFAAASVSGFRFRGNDGNPVTGRVNPQGEAYSKFGSDDPALEGYFELAGLELPPGVSTGSYQLSIEAVNALYGGDSGVGAAGYGSVSPSGTIAPIVIPNLTSGADVERDLVLTNSARVKKDSAEPNGFLAPSPAPAGGSWWATLSDRGDGDFYRLHVRGGRTLHLRVTALDEGYTSTTVKTQTTLGIWSQGAALNAVPQVKANPFNVMQNGQTRLSVTLGADADLMLGISDARSEGRPDFLYHARLLYADALTPSRIPSGGGTRLTLNGYGFNANTMVTIGGQNATVLKRTAAEMVLQAPALGNGPANVVVTDLANGDASTIIAGAMFGAVAGDQLQVLPPGNPGIPVGGTARFPTRVRVVAADGLTPVASVPVAFATAAPSFFTECGASACGVTTDALGEAAVTLAVRAVGENVISASIANGSTVQDSVVGTSPGTSIYAAATPRRVPQGVTTSIPISVRILNSGSAIPGQLVTFSFGTTPSSGAAALAAANVVTNSSGDAENTVQVTSLGSSFTILVCLFGGSPCSTINVLAIPASSLQLQVLGNREQILLQGETPAPVVLRVTDGSNPVRSAVVNVALTAFARTRVPECSLQNTDCRPVSRRPLASATAAVVTDDNGRASYAPNVQAAWGAADVYLTFTTGGQTQTALVHVFK